MLRAIEIIHPQRCREYWSRYYQLTIKSGELVKAEKTCSPRVDQIRMDLDNLAREISQHVRCCEQCQSWWRSYEIKA